jgi:hypothetical protein
MGTAFFILRITGGVRESKNQELNWMLHCLKKQLLEADQIVSLWL